MEQQLNCANRKGNEFVEYLKCIQNSFQSILPVLIEAIVFVGYT